jgi:hypothetical protein
VDLLVFPREGESVRKLNKVIQQETKMVDFVENTQKIFESVAAQNKKLEKKQTIGNKMAKIKHKILSALSTPIGNFKKLVDATDDTLLHVFAVKEITTRYGKQNIIVCSTSPNISETTQLTVYWTNTQINKYIEEKEQYWKRIEQSISGSITGILIFKFKKSGFYYNASRNKCAQIQIIAGRGNLCEEEERKVQIVAISTNAKECFKFDKLVKDKTLNIGDSITITGIREMV